MTSECDNAFHTLKEKMCTAPVLAFADVTWPFVVHTDASRDGLGAVLCQESSGKPRPVAYASRGLTRSERNYPAHKLELLPLKWSVTEKLKDYLYAARGTKVFTNNNPLTYVLTTAKLDATGHRWLAALTVFDFTLHYKPGTCNRDADALSRRPHYRNQDVADQREKIHILEARLQGENREAERQCDDEVIHAISAGLMIRPVGSEVVETTPYPLVNSLALSTEAIPTLYFTPGGDVSSGPVDWKKEQSKDQTIKKILPAVRVKKKPKVVADMTSQEKMMLAQFDKLVLRDEILYRRVINPVGEETFQLVLPETFREQAVRGLHDDLGHMGVERVVVWARQRFYWPKMVFQIEDWISHCLRCVSRKTTQNIVAPLVNITTSFPLELVCMDFLKLEPDRSGYSTS